MIPALGPTLCRPAAPHKPSAMICESISLLGQVLINGIIGMSE